MKEIHFDVPLILQHLYMGMSLSVPSGGLETGLEVGSKRVSIDAASSEPISLELKLLCVHSPT